MRQLWVRATGAVVAIVLLAAATSGLLRRWTLHDPAVRDGLLTGIERASGLSATASGATSFRLLPRPTVEIRSVAIRGLSDAVMLDADVFRGRLDLGALLRGELRVASAEFEDPTITLDVDRLQPLIAAAVRADPSRPLAMLHTAGLTVHAGALRFRSRDPRRDTLVTDLSATLEWPSEAAGASLSGSGAWRGISGQFGIDIDQFATVLRGGETLASGTLRSDALDLDLQGTLAGSGDVKASGKISGSTHDLPGFLRAIGVPAPQLAGLHQARLAANATVSGDTLSLDPATLGLDDMVFEGALAVHRRAGRTGLAGTLATDRIDLDPFVSALPPVVSDDGAWSDVALETQTLAYDDIDLRISATAARFRTFLMEDGSLSLQSGDGRLELSIGEARAYDGLLKGRIVATVENGVTDLRADANLSRLDVKAMLKDVPGNLHARGTVTSHLALGASGATPADLVRDVSGRGEVTVRDGEIGTRLITSIVRAAPSAKVSPLPLLAAGAPFDTASISVALDRGTATVSDSWVAWPSARAAIEGTASLPAQTLNLRATVTPDDADGAGEGDAAYALEGGWRDLLFRPVRPRS